MKNNKPVILEKKYHDKIADEFFLQRKYDFIWEIPERMLLLKYKYLSNKSIVEFGCGPSSVIKKVTQNCNLRLKNYIGVDISPRMIAIAKKNFPSGTFIIGDFTHIKLVNSSADTVISLGALHHSENKNKTLLKWIQILKKGGFLLLREPTLEALKKGMGASPIEEGIDVDEICKYLVNNNFIIVKKIFFCSPIFHLLNRALIKIFGDFWRKNELFWYPVMVFDIILCNTLGSTSVKFKGDSIALVAKKL